MNFLQLSLGTLFFFLYEMLLFKLTNLYYCKKNYNKKDRLGKCKDWHCNKCDTCIYSKYFSDVSLKYKISNELKNIEKEF